MKRKLLLLLFALGFSYWGWGQETIFNVAGGGSLPSGWTSVNNITIEPIDKLSYYLLEAGSASDYIITTSYDLSAYSTVVLNVDVATFGSGTSHPMKIEFSTNGGTSWSATTYITATPSSSTYITGGPITITQTFSSTTKFRFSNNGTSGRGVRIKNLIMTGTPAGSTPPTLTADATSNTVDNNIDITFTDDAIWCAAVTAVKIGGTALTVTTDYVLSAGNLQLKPSGLNALLTTVGSKSVTVEATGYSVASVTQQIDAGAATKLGIKTQPTAPASNGAVLATQPAVYIQDQYGNTTTSTATVVAAVGSGTWTLGGTTSVAAIEGTTTYSDLTATSAAAVTGATISFTSSGLTGINSSTFDIPAPPLDAPVAIAATNISTTGFTANWNAAASATSYRLDVSEYETFATSGGNMTDLIISEYVEGSSYNKGIELFNGTGSSVDLSSYSLMKQTNGAGDFGSELTLTGTLENNITFVIILNQASQELLNYADLVTNSSCINFNGNDAVALYKSGVQIDVVGVVDQVNPDWGANVTLVRKSSVSSPTINYSSDDWDSYSEDTFSHLGSHTFSGGSTPSYVTGYENLTVAGTSQTISNLTPNTTYYYRVRATDGVETSVNSNTISASTNASTASTYTGTGNWSEVGNWSDGLPGASTNVTVNGTLTVDDVVECDDLTISTSGAVTVTAGQGLFINGDFLIQSSAAGTGSFIGATADYDITGSTTVQRYLSKYDAAGDSKYHFISSPVATQEIFTDLTDLYRYSEVTNYWINRTSSGDPEAFGDATFVVGRGYLVANVADVTKVFTGTLNSFLTGTPLVLTGTNTPDKGDGWNLFGNPFPSAIDWDGVVKGDGMDNALYYYDASIENYKYYIQLEGETGAVGSGSQYIPAMQGFMVHAKSAGTTTISIDNGDRVHEAQTVFYKAATAIPGSLSMKVSAGDYEDVAFIHFNEGATTQFDGAYDAYKLSSYNTLVPMIYTQSSNNEDLAINGLPELTEELVIPVYFVPGTEGIQTLTANLEGLMSTVVYLKDNKTNTTQNLTQNPIYSFTATEGDNPDRFLLHFGIVGIEDNTSNLSQINAYAYQNRLYVQSNLNEARVSLFDIQGHQLFSREIVGAGSSRIPLDLPSGIYIVRLQSNNQVKNVKVFIN